MTLRGRLAVAIVATASLLALSACDDVDSGVITAKHHKSSRVIPAGKTMIIQSEKWVLDLRDCSVNPCRKGSEDVSKSEYRHYQVGDVYGR